MMGGGGVQVISLGLKFWPKVIFLGREKKTEGYFWVAIKGLRDFLGYAKKSSDFFG